jgi:hypothetical protein
MFRNKGAFHLQPEKSRKSIEKRSKVCGESVMGIRNDYKELIALFNAHNVAYVIAGVFALGEGLDTPVFSNVLNSSVISAIFLSAETITGNA